MPAVVVWMDMLCPALAFDRSPGHRQAELLEEPGRAGQQPVRPGLEIGEAGRLVDEPQPLLAPPERFRGLVAGLDVARDAQVCLCSVGQAERDGMGLDVAPAALEADDLVSPD